MSIDIDLISSDGLPRTTVAEDGVADVTPMVTGAHSTTMSGGLIELDACSFEWEMLYDEIVFVHEGTVRFRYGDAFDKVLEGKPGDAFWLPKGCRVKYEGDNAKAFYAVYPVNWREMAEKADEA